MASLGMLWFCAAVVTVFVVALAAELLTRGAVRAGGAPRRRTEREALISALVGGDDGTGRRAFHRRGRDGPFEILHELLQLVRGRERDRIIAAATRLGAPAALQTRVRRGRFRARILAAETLAFFPGAASERALTRACADPDARVRGAALKALVAIGAAPSIESLLIRIAREGARRQSALAGVLRAAVAEQPLEAIVALARPGLSPHLQIVLSDSLAAARCAEAAPLLRLLAAGGPPPVRGPARQALGVLRGRPGAGPAEPPPPRAAVA